MFSLSSKRVEEAFIGVGKALSRVRIRAIPWLLYHTAPLVLGDGTRLHATTSGFKIVMNPREYFSCLMVYGRYGREMVALLRQIVRTGDSVIDIGAQLGYVSCHLALLVGVTGQVHSFEPDPRALERLWVAVRENHFSWVRVFPVAAAAEEGKITFYVSPVLGWSTAVAGTHRTDCSAIEVRAARVDTLAQTGGIRRPVRFIKVDVEGFECSVLDGMRELIAEDRPYLLTEVNPRMLGARGLSSVDLLSPLQKCGYRFYAVEESRGLLRGGEVDLRPVDPSRVLPFCDVLCVPEGGAVPSQSPAYG
jgi:FkbM family methyltransferase